MYEGIMSIENSITELEIQLAHHDKTIEELSDIIADQAKRLERAENRITMLMQRAADTESQSMSGEVVGNAPPPHW